MTKKILVSLFVLGGGLALAQTPCNPSLLQTHNNIAGPAMPDSRGCDWETQTNANAQKTEVAVGKAYRLAGNFSGADWCSQANAADAEIGSVAGEIWVDSTVASPICETPLIQSGPRVYKFLGSNLNVKFGQFNFSKHPVVFDCDERQQTIFTFSGSASAGPAFNADWAEYASGTYGDWGYGILNCELVGPGGENGSNSRNAGLGLQIGTPERSTIGFMTHNMRISGFKTGITWGNCSAWGSKISDSNILNNTQNLYHGSCGGGALSENLEFIHDVFGWTNTNMMNTCGVEFAGTGTVEANFIDSSFDGDEVCNSGGNLKFINPHFEDPMAYTQGAVSTVYYNQSAGQTILINPKFWQDGTAGSIPPAFVNLTGGSFYFENLQAYSAAPMGSVISINGGGRATVGLHGVVQSESGKFVNGTLAGTNTGSTVICPDVNNVCLFSLAGSSIILGPNTGVKAAGAGSFIQAPIAPIGSLAACSPPLEGVYGTATDCEASCRAGGTCTHTSSSPQHCEVRCNGSAYVETGR